MSTQTISTIQWAGEIPPVSQLPLILWPPRRRRRKVNRGRFRMFPEELNAKLFNNDGYSAVVTGRC